MNDHLRMATEIVEGGNLNKLNQLLALKMNDELAQTLRRIFQYLQQQELFEVTYNSEWQEWYAPNYKPLEGKSQVDLFLNVKWSVFLRILFQNKMFQEIILTVQHSVNCPAYRRLVKLSFSEQIEIEFDQIYFQIASQFDLDFEEIVHLLKQLPEEFDKDGVTKVIQKAIQTMNQENKLKFTKIINSHVVDKVDNPLILANFLHNNVETGDLELQLYSLQSMLILMTNYHYNLDNFYEKLIELTKNTEAYVPRFLKLIEVATRSSKISQQLLLEIIKHVLEQCLKQTCSLQLWATSLTFNIFKRHTTLRNQYYLGTLQILNSYQDHWHPEIRKIISYLQDDLECFDYLTDLTDLTDVAMLDALFV